MENYKPNMFQLQCLKALEINERRDNHETLRKD